MGCFRIKNTKTILLFVCAFNGRPRYYRIQFVTNVRFYKDTYFKNLKNWLKSRQKTSKIRRSKIAEKFKCIIKTVFMSSFLKFLLFQINLAAETLKTSPFELNETADEEEFKILQEFLSVKLMILNICVEYFKALENKVSKSLT